MQLAELPDTCITLCGWTSVNMYSHTFVYLSIPFSLLVSFEKVIRSHHERYRIPPRLLTAESRHVKHQSTSDKRSFSSARHQRRLVL